MWLGLCCSLCVVDWSLFVVSYRCGSIVVCGRCVLFAVCGVCRRVPLVVCGLLCVVCVVG